MRSLGPLANLWQRVCVPLFIASTQELEAK